MSKTRTVLFSDSTFSALEQEAKNTGKSVNKVINECVARCLLSEKSIELKRIGRSIRDLVENYKAYKASLE